MQFYPGWLHEAEARAKANWSGSPPRFGADALADIDISDAAFTLASQIRFWFNQGPVGSCFANAVCASIQNSISAAVAAGATFDEIQLSRAAVWYFGRYLDGSVGSRGDGGSITNAMKAIHDFGIPHEVDWPYKPDHDWLDRKPPDAVMQNAKQITIQGMVDLDFSDSNGLKKTIKSGLPPVIGIWWPYGWDTNFTSDGIVTSIGSGVYGHALCIIGWATWNGKLYWHIQNSHGGIYPPLSANVASAVTGWAPAPSGQSYCFWVPDTLLRTVASYGNAELVAPVSVIAPGNKEALSWLAAAA